MPHIFARLSQLICDSQPCSYDDSALDMWSTGAHLPWSSSWYREAGISHREASATRCFFLLGSCGASYVFEFIILSRVWKLVSHSLSQL